MDKKEIIKELIYKISDTYRQQRNKVDKIQGQIFQLSVFLEDDNVSYKKYLKIQDDLIYLKQKYIEEDFVAKGMELAREELLNEL